MAKWLTVSLAAVMAVAIATTASAQGEKEKKVKRDRYIITPEEIAEKSDITNAEEAVQRLRPQWFRVSRAKGGLGGASYGSKSYRPSAKSTGSEDNPSPDMDASASNANSKRDQMMAEDGKKEGGPVLYVDDVKQPSIDELRNIRVAEISEIRYMTGNDATGRYGDGHQSGAILLKTNRLGR